MLGIDGRGLRNEEKRMDINEILNGNLGKGDVFRYEELESGLVEGLLSDGYYVFRYVDGLVERYYIDLEDELQVQELENVLGVVEEYADGFGYRFSESEKCGISFEELDDDEVTWFIPYFDVRNRMVDQPNEWVGVLFGDGGVVYKVGFCYDSMTACVVDYGSDVDVDIGEDGVMVLSKEDIVHVVPIERYEGKLDPRDTFYF